MKGRVGQDDRRRFVDEADGATVGRTDEIRLVKPDARLEIVEADVFARQIGDLGSDLDEADFGLGREPGGAEADGADARAEVEDEA